MDNFNEENNKELMEIFQTEAEDISERLFANLLSLETKLTDKELISNIYRDLHSLKGAVRMVGYKNIQAIFHKMEDIFDKVKDNKFSFDQNTVIQLTRSLEIAVKYIQASIIEGREIIGEEFSPVISTLEILEEQTELNQNSQTVENCDLSNFQGLGNLAEIAGLSNSIQSDTINTENSIEQNNTKSYSFNNEEINLSINKAFEIIDSIVPEEESQDIIILKEEIEKIYSNFKDTDLYEIKTSLETIVTKLELVMAATNTLTVSEILEIRNELSSAAAKYTTTCIDKECSGLTFFDIAEKISLLQGSSVYAPEIKDDILTLKKTVEDSNILEIINMVLEILNFITENSVQLEEQMMLTLKSGIEYCASPNENIDSDLIVQQLEIMKQLLELNYKKDSGLTEIKTLTSQSFQSGSSLNSNEIKTLHVNAQKLDTLVNQLGELIITKIKTEKNLDKIDIIKNTNESCQKDLLKTSNYLRYYNRKYLQNMTGSEQYINIFVKQVFTLLSDITQNVSRTIYDLNSLYRSSKEDDIKMRLIIDEMESMVKNIRVLPISTVFNSFSRMVRDIASEKGKDIDFEIDGNDTCADKKIIEEIKTPLIHILRNAIDHGIEPRDERMAAGKSPVGKIMLSAHQDDNKVIINVADDGRGFNLAKIKDRAVSRGFLTQDDIDTMSDEAIMNIIFWPGFTTGDSITSVSGRGIGLDVVKTKISQLNGKVKVISEFGKGSCVNIEIPVTLTTLRVFLVKISEQIFAIPIQVISTFIVKKQEEINTNNGVRSILYNSKIIPLYYLSDILKLKKPAESEKHEKETILIIETDDKIIGLVVDKLLGDQDILQKKLSAPLYKVKNIAGITNLASGELCLILNMQDIMHYDFNKAISLSSKTPALISKDILSYKKILLLDDSITTRTLVKNILMNAGYTIDVVSDTEEALVKLKLNHYDLIISDLTMPDISGYEFISTIKNDEMFADIPVAVMSAVPQKEAMNKLSSYNIEAFFAKDSFNQKEFMQKIQAILTRYHV